MFGRLSLSTCAVAALVASVPPAAWAQTHAPPAALPADPAPAERWYGYQTLLTSGVGAVAINAAALWDKPKVLGPALGLYAFGGPVVHLANRQPRRAAASLAFGAGAAMVGMLAFMAGFAIEEPCHFGLGHESDEALRGGRCRLPEKMFLASLLLAPTLDAMLLGWKPAPSPDRTAPSRTTASALLSPFFSVRDRGATFGVRSVF